MHDLLPPEKFPSHGINANLSSDDRSYPLRVDRLASGRFGVGLLVPFYRTGKTTVRARLRLPPDAQVTLEAHGFASRFQKIRASFSGKGELLQVGDELISAECGREGEFVSIQLEFYANNTRNEFFYVFLDEGADQFVLQDFIFDHPNPEFADVTSLGRSVHFEVRDVFVFRNYLQIDFELLKAGAELVSLALDCPIPVQATQWWAGRAVELAPDSALKPQAPIGSLPSPVAMERYGAAFGDRGHSIRVLFSEFQDFRLIDVVASDAVVQSTKLICRFSDGSSEVLPLKFLEKIPGPLSEDTKVIASVVASSGGRTLRFLELGGRGDASRHVRENIAVGYEYCSIDIEPGPNVDVVGDAHKMSALFPAGHFDIIYSHSVLEHLIAPWQVIIEANKLLRPGGYFIAYVPTTWPLHAEPWDFWRMSRHAWPGLLNELTGFKICRVEEIGRAAIVPSALKISGNTRMQHDPAPLFTSVVAQKIAEAEVRWDSLGADDLYGRYTP